MPHLFAPLTMGRPGLIDGRDPAEVAHADACDVICQSVAKVSSASWPKKVGLIPPTPKRRVVV
jgi:hypothetical protein